MAPSHKMVAMPILGPAIYRLDADENARKSAWPSLSFEDPRKREELLEGVNGSALTKELALAQCRVQNGQQTVIIKLPAGTSFYGTGEVGGDLERTGRRVVTWNTDAWGYGRSTSSLYQSHPWVLAVLPDGSAVGVLADTTRRCEVDLRKEGTIKLTAPAPYPLITFGPFPKPEDVLGALTAAIGRIGMPPKWTLGYHQCRFSYETAARVREVAATFREKRLPCDVIWMDIDYMHGFRCFTFDPKNYPDPKGLAEDLHAQGFKAVWMIDPGIKAEEGYWIHDSGEKEDVWVQKANGQPFIGNVWPGPCRFPDYTIERTRKWWAKLIAEFVEHGVDGIWNDMNEPSVFNTVSKTMPENNIHRGDAELGGKQSHVHYHNVYGMLMARATWEGIQQARPNNRPFVLTRAAYIGSHRYAATWTGDNLATWEHLHFSIPMALNLGMSGQPFSGPDIGGFAGDSTPRLFARWMGIGALLPFSRGHSETGTRDHEPWSFGAECEAVSRLALERRYRLLPHFYTLFYLCHMTGVPVMAPLFFADPKDPKLREVEDAFLLGPLLVATSTAKGSGLEPDSKVVLPSGIWQRFHFNDSHPDLPLLFVRGGGIVPVAPVRQSVEDLKAEDPITLLVALDENGKAQGSLFEDAGDGYGYKDGDFLLTRYEAATDGGDVVARVGATEGHRPRPKRDLVVRLLLGDGAQVEAAGKDGEEIWLRLPSSDEVSSLKAAARRKESRVFEKAGGLPGDMEQEESHKGQETLNEPIDLLGGPWKLTIAPWAGGRIISMFHKPSGREWLESKVEMGGYEEYSETEYRSAGCTEQYAVIGREVTQMEGEDAVQLEGDIGQGLAICRRIEVPAGAKDTVHISSSIEAKAVGAGAGGFSRIVCLRVHPSFKLAHPQEAIVAFTAIDGSPKELSPEFGEAVLKGNDRPNGEWRLMDREAGWVLVNRFDVSQVDLCFLHWGGGFCNLELWSEERPVSKDTPLAISHSYEIKKIGSE